MLALVHPTQPTPSSSSSSTARPSSSRLSQRRPPVSTTSSFSRISRPAHYHPDPQPPPPPPPPPPPQPTPPVTTRPLAPDPGAPLDIHSYSSQDLLRLLASFLTHMATSNDHLHPHSPVPSDQPPSLLSLTPSHAGHHAPMWRSLTTASRTALGTPSPTIIFHARNIPTISLEAYLLRILKYCPATNEVFLSLLVYFERMSKMSTEATGKPFIIDSYNIHRLVIAGVTVASKFFSDVFYTNSRYAKVGGLPQAELNQLELQFLLLNDFRLVIHKDEMQHYAELLIRFTSNSTLPPIVPFPTTSAPSLSMSAVDGHGGQVLGDRRSPSSVRTPNVRPRFGHTRTMSESTTTTEGETEPETEVETDGGETDDEPTIRPAHSSGSSTCEDADSLYAYRSAPDEDDTGDEGGDEGDDDDESGQGREMDDDDDAGGDLTPERRPAVDERMSSP